MLVGRIFADSLPGPMELLVADPCLPQSSALSCVGLITPTPLCISLIPGVCIGEGPAPFSYSSGA